MAAKTIRNALETKVDMVREFKLKQEKRNIQQDNVNKERITEVQMSSMGKHKQPLTWHEARFDDLNLI